MLKKDVIIACDVEGRKELYALLDKFPEGEKPYVKIGMELFYAEGPDIVRELKARGHKIFLDLKLHDIPNTVQRAMRRLAVLGVDMTNLHAAGGLAMMQAAMRGLQEGAGQNKTPKLIAVTMLTSTSKDIMNKELCIAGEVPDIVAAYATTAQQAGLDGIVCSPLESPVVKKACGKEFLCVTPGIRYPEGDKGDQQRVTSPQDAAAIGSDYIVVGRPITAAENPLEAYRRVVRDFCGE